MVDLDDLESMKDGGDDGKESKSDQQKQSTQEVETSSQTDTSSTGGSSGVHSVSEDEMVKPSNKEVSDISQEWASDKGEMNFDAHSSEDLQSYMTRQVREVEELHENIREMAKNNNENFDEFTLYMHAMFLNFGQNRVGIFETIKSEFGKSDKEAMALTNKICQKAGEPEFMENIVQDISRNLAGF